MQDWQGKWMIYHWKISENFINRNCQFDKQRQLANNWFFINLPKGASISLPKLQASKSLQNVGAPVRKMLVEGKHDSNNEERFWYIELVHRGYRGNLSHPRSIVVFFMKKPRLFFRMFHCQRGWLVRLHPSVFVTMKMSRHVKTLNEKSLNYDKIPNYPGDFPFNWIFSLWDIHGYTKWLLAQFAPSSLEHQ